MILTILDIVALTIVLTFCIPLVEGFVKGVRQGIAKYRVERATPSQVATPQPCSVHVLIPIDAQPLTYNDIAHTCVLMRCEKCTFVTTALFVGNWPIETFLKRESDVARELRALEGMVR